MAEIFVVEDTLGNYQTAPRTGQYRSLMAARDDLELGIAAQMGALL